MAKTTRVGGIALVLAGVVAAATLPLWKLEAKKHFRWVVIATNVYQDTLRRAHINVAQIGQPDFEDIPATAIPNYLSRINATYGTYTKYGQLDSESLRGSRVLEVGPGETLGVALRLIGAGASHVTAVDKFVPVQSSPFHRLLYEALAADVSPIEQRDMKDAADWSADPIRLNPRRLTYVYGTGVEDSTSELTPESFDVIVSNAVLEEVYDLERALGALDRLLRPGGRQVHVVDLRDYGMFSKYGYHPLEFLTVPDAVYRYMVESTGQPNRWLINDYRRALAERGYDAVIYTTHVLGSPDPLQEYQTALIKDRHYSDSNLAVIRSIRPRLLQRYAQLPDEDLLSDGILIVARKRSVPPSSN